MERLGIYVPPHCYYHANYALLPLYYDSHTVLSGSNCSSDASWCVNHIVFGGYGSNLPQSMVLASIRLQLGINRSLVVLCPSFMYRT